MSAHTPGPWFLRTNRHRDTDGREWGWLDVHPPGTLGQSSPAGVRVEWTAGTLSHANARLVAAAPAMLAKLEQLAGECAECHGTGFAVLPFSGGQSSRARCPECADVRAVIALATQP